MPRLPARGGKRLPKGKARYNRPRRFARRRHPITNVNRSLQPIPARYICKMKYSETVTTNSAGLIGQYVFNLNSLFDPNRTGFGHQPYGFDNLALLYNRYRVIATGWRIQRAAGTAEASTAMLVGAMPSNDLNCDFTDFSYMRENPRAKWILQNPGAAAVTLQSKCYLPALMGRTKAQYMADDKYQSDVTTSPSENALLYIQTHNPVTDTAVAGTVQVLLEFTVEWFDVKHILQS